VLRLLGLWGPVAAWMALIFGVSSLQMPPGSASIPDWISHGGVYAGLAALTCRALAGGVRAAPWRVAVLAGAVSSLYGVTDEWHQVYVPHRTAEAADVMKDMGGAVLGAALFHLLAPRLAGAPGRPA
jgi:VanZ family protein